MKYNFKYQLLMNIDESCKFLCSVRYELEDQNYFKWAIDHSYRQSFVIDNLPSIRMKNNETNVGFPLGYLKVII